MAITDLPILSMLKSRMFWHEERQKVLADNVSNSDTPGFRARELAPLKFEEQMPAPQQVALERTAGGHFAGIASGGVTSRFRTETPRQYEVRPNGNTVNLEEEMMKVASNQMDYQAATALYTRSMSLLKSAMGKR